MRASFEGFALAMRGEQGGLLFWEGAFEAYEGPARGQRD